MEVSDSKNDIVLDKSAIVMLRHGRGLILRGWTKEWLAKDSAGTWVSARDKSACEWCLLGSLIACSVGDDHDAYVRAIKELESCLPLGCTYLATFNDRVAKSADDIVELIDKAIAKLEANSTTV